MYWLGSESHNIFKKVLPIFQKKQITPTMSNLICSNHTKLRYWKGAESHFDYDINDALKNTEKKLLQKKT